MKVQVLVATMNQTDHSLLDKMNIQTDVIVGNQCDRNLVEEFSYQGHDAKYYSFHEKGVGLNRNNTLMRASGDICLLADDDMVYVDGYEKKIIEAFEKNKDADVVIYNLIEKEPKRYIISKKYRINYFNYLKFGTARIAFRLKSIKENGIYFNQCFGGGTEHCHGEDTLFLTSCLKNKLKIYAIPEYIAALTDERESTWNNSDIKKYLKDQGFLYQKISRKYWRILCLQDAVRHQKRYQTNFWNAYKIMLSGGMEM